MSNIEHKDYIDIRDLLKLVIEAIELLDEVAEDPEKAATATVELWVNHANEDIEAVLGVLRDLGYPADDANDIERAVNQVMNRVGVTFIAGSYLMESAEESLCDQGAMPTGTHPWLKVEIDEEAVKRAHTEVTLNGKPYYFEKE